MEQPLVSVIVPVFNTEKYVGEAINSVLAQGYPNLEIIAVDDASTDNTLRVLRDFGEKIKIISLKKNSGPAAARNAGLKIAKGSIIGFVDADDIWLPEHINKMLPCLIEEGYDFAYGLTKFFRDLDGKRELTEELSTEGHVSAAIYKKSFLDKVGPLDESMRYGEDLDWNMRMKEAGGKGKSLDFAVTMYRRHNHNMTNDKNMTKAGLIEAFKKRIARINNQKNGNAKNK